MSERDWELMKDAELDLALKNSIPELPPDDIVMEVTPWRKAMNRSLAGLALTTITLNFLGLNYILPAVGVIMMLLGFRALRGENGWFKGCWIITSVRTVCIFASLILNATIYQETVYASRLSDVFIALNVAMVFLMLFLLWKGFRAVQIKAGLPAHAGGAAAMIVWYALVCLLAAAQYTGWIILIALIFAYVLIIRSLLKLSRELDEAGYAICPAAVRVSDRTLVIALLAAVAAGIVCGRLFFNSYPMQWQPVEISGDAGTAEIKAELSGLGFPGDILNDLTDEDIKACEGASRVFVETNFYSADEGRVVERVKDGVIYNETVYDDNLRITGIAVELDGGRWKIFHHFRWLNDPGAYGTESLQLWPAYHLQRQEDWSAVGDVSGRLLCETDGRTLTAPYYSLGSETYDYDSVFWGTETVTDVFAAFSLPRGGESCRGYVTYDMVKLQDGWMINSWINYTHQRSWFLYPAVTADEYRKSGSWDLDGSFILIQDALQFFPDDEDAEMPE